MPAVHGTRGASALMSRDRKLRRLSYRVVRLDAELVLRDLPAAVALIRAALWTLPLSALDRHTPHNDYLPPAARSGAAASTALGEVGGAQRPKAASTDGCQRLTATHSEGASAEREG